MRNFVSLQKILISQYSNHKLFEIFRFWSIWFETNFQKYKSICMINDSFFYETYRFFRIFVIERFKTWFEICIIVFWYCICEKNHELIVSKCKIDNYMTIIELHFFRFNHKIISFSILSNSFMFNMIFFDIFIDINFDFDLFHDIFNNNNEQKYIYLFVNNTFICDISYDNWLTIM